MCSVCLLFAGKGHSCALDKSYLCHIALERFVQEVFGWMAIASAEAGTGPTVWAVAFFASIDHSAVEQATHCCCEQKAVLNYGEVSGAHCCMTTSQKQDNMSPGTQRGFTLGCSRLVLWDTLPIHQGHPSSQVVHRPLLPTLSSNAPFFLLFVDRPLHTTESVNTHRADSVDSINVLWIIWLLALNWGSNPTTYKCAD
jgi:hypothetical protein